MVKNFIKRCLKSLGFVTQEDFDALMSKTISNNKLISKAFESVASDLEGLEHRHKEILRLLSKAILTTGEQLEFENVLDQLRSKMSQLTE